MLMAKMQLGFVLLCFVLMAGYCAPLDQRAKEAREEAREALRKAREKLGKGPLDLPDVPGLDKEEYKRYWEELAKSNPSKPVARPFEG